MLLLMTVEPGFGGQHFLDLVLPKLRRARALVAERGAEIWLQVDGGVHEGTIERCAEAGADVFVAGSAVYGSDDPARAVQALRAQAERATAHAAWTVHRPPRLRSLFSGRTGLADRARARPCVPGWRGRGSVRLTKSLLRMSSSAHTAPTSASAGGHVEQVVQAGRERGLDGLRHLTPAGRREAGQQLADLALPDHGHDARGRRRHRRVTGQVVLPARR